MTRADARALALAFHELLRRFQFQDVHRACDYGISITECHALELLALEGTLSVNDIAAALRVNKSTASRAVQSLVGKGLARRSENADDARAWKVRATAAGRRTSQEILEGSIRCYGDALRDLSPSERRAAIEVLRRLSRVKPPLTACGPSRARSAGAA